VVPSAAGEPLTGRLRLLREAIRRPLPLAYHPLYRFYAGGSMTRAFRGLPDRADDWWSEDWVGSCTQAGNTDPQGRPQGLSTVEVPGAGPVPLREIIEALPAEMVGAAFAARWGPVSGFLVKLLSPAGQVPLHAHPTRAWAHRHLGSPYGKTEAWILLDAPGDGREPAYAGIGFAPGIDRDWFAGAVRSRDRQAVRGTLHRTEIRPGEVYVAHAGVPHYLGPRLSFIEIQEPSDHIVIAETDGDDDDGATMGLGWDLALDMIDYTAADAAVTLARARQQPRVLRTSHASREVRLLGDDVLPFFDATELEVADDIEVSDGRLSVVIVAAGNGHLETDYGSHPVQRGQTLALPACLPFRARAGAKPLRIIRCLGPVT
jgi:mannose-6-phosphate isomerase